MSNCIEVDKKLSNTAAASLNKLENKIDNLHKSVIEISQRLIWVTKPEEDLPLSSGVELLPVSSPIVLQVGHLSGETQESINILSDMLDRLEI